MTEKVDHLSRNIGIEQSDPDFQTEANSTVRRRRVTLSLGGLLEALTPARSRRPTDADKDSRAPD